MRSTFLFLALASAFPRSAVAQITLEHVYPADADVVSGPALIEIAPDEHKYLVEEWSQGSFTLYNLDHTLFQTFTPAIPLYQAPYYYQPIYISRSLFDCDPSNIEFAVAFQQFNDTGGYFTVLRENGDVLLSEHQATVPYCLGCGVGSRMDRGITNTEDGAKLMVMYWTGTPGQGIYKVFDLCGELPDGLHEPAGPGSATVYPNPSSAGFTIELPAEDAGLHRIDLLSANGTLVLRTTFTGTTWKLDPGSVSDATGLYYYYRILSSNRRIYAGKLVWER